MKPFSLFKVLTAVLIVVTSTQSLALSEAEKQACISTAYSTGASFNSIEDCKASYGPNSPCPVAAAENACNSGFNSTNKKAERDRVEKEAREAKEECKAIITRLEAAIKDYEKACTTIPGTCTPNSTKCEIENSCMARARECDSAKTVIAEEKTAMKISEQVNTLMRLKYLGTSDTTANAAQVGTSLTPDSADKEATAALAKCPNTSYKSYEKKKADLEKKIERKNEALEKAIDAKKKQTEELSDEKKKDQEALQKLKDEIAEVSKKAQSEADKDKREALEAQANRAKQKQALMEKMSALQSEMVTQSQASILATKKFKSDSLLAPSAASIQAECTVFARGEASKAAGGLTGSSTGKTAGIKALFNERYIQCRDSKNAALDQARDKFAADSSKAREDMKARASKVASLKDELDSITSQEASLGALDTQKEANRTADATAELNRKTTNHAQIQAAMEAKLKSLADTSELESRVSRLRTELIAADQELARLGPEPANENFSKASYSDLGSAYAKISALEDSLGEKAEKSPECKVLASEYQKYEEGNGGARNTSYLKDRYGGKQPSKSGGGTK